MVADTWARLPVRDGAVDRVLVVFAPRNGAGDRPRAAAATAGSSSSRRRADHLAELVGPLGLLRVDPDKAARLAASLEPHLEPVATAVHRERLRLDRAAVATLVGMGPHARHLARDDVRTALAALPEPLDVTVSVQIGTYRPAS